MQLKRSMLRSCLTACYTRTKLNKEGWIRRMTNYFRLSRAAPLKALPAIVIAALLVAIPADGAIVTVFHGDADGFGVGATTFKNPAVNSAGGGEASGTDIRLIGTGFVAPAFQPTSTLSFAAISDPILSIQITLSMAEFGGDISPVNGPNSIVLDGLAVPVTFLGGFASFASGANPNVQTLSAFLPIAFFPLFADGSVNLTGTRISERSGFGSFQIDYLRFDVTTADVPEPASAGMVLLGFAGLGVVMRRRTTRR